MLSYTFAPDAEFRLMLPHHAAVYSALVIKDHAMLGQWLPWAAPDFDEVKAREMIIKYQQRLGNNAGMMLGMFYQNQFAGWASYRHWDWEARSTEIGYMLGQDFQGKGLITAAVRAMTNYAFAELGMIRIEIMTEPENVKSAAVPERLGYTLEGIRRHYFIREGVPRDLKVYVILKEEWEAKQ